jgi:tetratricopeptide (TPR) repeat protein
MQGCASSSPQTKIDGIEQYFIDAQFAQVDSLIEPLQLFSLSNQVTQTLRQDFLKSRMSKDYIMANRWLANYINASDGGFEYRDNVTRIAQATFDDRSGNCLSLVLLTASLAEVLDVEVEFQEIEVPPVWDKQGDFYLVNGHINLRLIPKETNNTYLVSKDAIQVDFLPERTMRGYAKKRIDKTTVMAMFYNNIAAESLVEGQYDLAYAYIKQSLLLKPEFVPALNTLGILYRYKGLDDAAETVYKLALSQESEDLNALYNYAVLLSNQNRLDEWAELHKTLELARIRNPYYYYDMAQQAYFDREYERALIWYKRAVEKADYRHEFYFGLSRAYWATGDERRAQSNLEKALSLSGDDMNKRRYQAKLQAMQTH